MSLIAFQLGEISSEYSRHAANFSMFRDSIYAKIKIPV